MQFFAMSGMIQIYNVILNAVKDLRSLSFNSFNKELRNKCSSSPCPE